MPSITKVKNWYAQSFEVGLQLVQRGQDTWLTLSPLVVGAGELPKTETARGDTKEAQLVHHAKRRELTKLNTESKLGEQPSAGRRGRNDAFSIARRRPEWTRCEKRGAETDPAGESVLRKLRWAGLAAGDTGLQ